MSFVKFGFRGMALLLLAFVVCAQSDTTTQPTIKTPAAIAAKAKYDKSVKDAQDAYIKALQAAQAEYITALDKARMDAYKADNVAEVEALSKEKYRIQEEQKSLSPEDGKPALVQLKSVTGTVTPKQRWTKVLDVKEGQVLEITATGTWRGHDSKDVSDPDGTKGRVLYGNNSGALMGKVGENGVAFLVGKSVTYTVKSDGSLFLGPNSHFNWSRDNNTGELKVTVNVKAPKR